ncbi:MAG: hypothetical protein KA885_01725 [Spirochaetes bacterium]|nr:hypothetical protein [Spirochaetota bacterium]
MKKFALIFIIATTLVSCFNLKIDLNADKTGGTMTMDYDINDDYFQLISIILSNIPMEDGEQFDPFILIDDSAMRGYFDSIDKAKMEGITLKKVSIKKDEKSGYYKGNVVITFKDFEKSLALLPKAVSGLTIKRDKELTTINQVMNFEEMDKDGIFKDFIEQLKEDDVDFYKLLTEKAKFDFSITTKTPVKKSSGVVLGKDGKSVSYSFKVNDMLDDSKKSMNFMMSF